jgi:hypothetical protein
MGRFRILALSVLAVGLTSLVFPSWNAVAAPKAASAETAAPSSDLSAQRRRVRRPPLRIEVYPRYLPEIGRSGPRIDVYPRPYPYEWPGPNAHRECVGWLAPEARVSGTVIVPRRRCWWAPGAV